MSSEETPLLQAAENGRDAVYDRFSRRKKMAIVGMVSGCGVMPRKHPRIIDGYPNC